MGLVVQVNPVGSLDGAAPIFDHSPSPTGDVHPCAEAVVAGVGSDGSISRGDIPWQDYLKRNCPWPLEAVTGKETGVWLSGFGSRSRFPGIGLSSPIALAHVSVQKIELEKLPTSPLPVATGTAAAIGSSGEPSFTRGCACGEPQAA